MPFTPVNVEARTNLFKVLLMRRLGADAIRRARAACRSKTLRRSMELVGDLLSLKVKIFIPHYWAHYFHFGRGVVKTVKKRFLVWFKNPRLDPRNAGGYAVRANPQRRLTRAQFRDAVKAKQVIVTKSSGPTSPNKINPFFNEGLGNFNRECAPIVREEMDRYVAGLAFSEKDTAKINL